MTASLLGETPPLMFSFVSFEWLTMGSILFPALIMGFLFSGWPFRKKKPKFTKMVAPNLGMWIGQNAELEAALKQLIDHLENAIDQKYKDQVGQMIYADESPNSMHFENNWFEWKRFLILATQIPFIPMNSYQVDEIWHQKLSFTKKYADFSQRFFGFRFAHQPHAPKSEPITDPVEQEWFVFLYSLLFKKNGYSHYVWNLDYHHPLPYQKLDDFRHLSVEELAEKHFFPLSHQKNPLVAELTKQIIRQIQFYICEVDDHVKQHGESIDQYREHVGDWPNLKRLNSEDWNEQPSDRDRWALKTLLFFSLYQREQFLRYQNWIHQRESFEVASSRQIDGSHKISKSSNSKSSNNKNSNNKSSNRKSSSSKNTHGPSGSDYGSGGGDSSGSGFSCVGGF